MSSSTNADFGPLPNDDGIFVAGTPTSSFESDSDDIARRPAKRRRLETGGIAYSSILNMKIQTS